MQDLAVRETFLYIALISPNVAAKIVAILSGNCNRSDRAIVFFS